MASARAVMGRAALGIACAFLPLGVAGHASDEPAKPAAAPPPTAAAALEKSRALFTNASCGSCHALADAGASGEVGPPLDHNPNLNPDFVVARIANGQGGMPPFREQLSAAEIADLSAYILQVAAK